MANKNNINVNPRGVHVSPGIYTNELELTYAAKSLGITTLGVVGETVKGPAFQPIEINDWREFQDVFGGTDPSKFKGSQYPKYELPYIAKSYLKESRQLEVVRVLGLCGYGAGPAWVVTASNGGNDKYAVAVIRSRGAYQSYGKTVTDTSCTCNDANYDVLRYFVGEKSGNGNECSKQGYNDKALQIKAYVPMNDSGNECDDYDITTGSTDNSWNVSQSNHGRFKLVGWIGPKDASSLSGSSYDFEYAVSLNPFDKEYILNVLGTKADDGDAPIYVETLYDVALDQAIANASVNKIDSALTFFNAYETADYCHLEPITDLMSVPSESLTRKYVGARFLATSGNTSNADAFKCVKVTYETGKPTIDDPSKATETVKAGHIYTVRQYTTTSGKRVYYYAYYTEPSDTGITGDERININDDLKGSESARNTADTATLVFNNADGLYYRMSGTGTTNVAPVTLDMHDYHSAYRYASTPWIVSNLKGDIKKVDVNKLFRFHTISDGDSSNYQIKVSIENIRPDEGTFDVVVRDINDTDALTVGYEKFTKCTMVPGDANYIAYKIGSFDGTYEAKSKYITVEVNETTAAKMSVPCGFLGYPIPQYGGTPIVGSGDSKLKFPTIMYNRNYDTELKAKKQYFGLSSLVGVDVDNFTFKGRKAYIDNPLMISHGFHLDSRLDSGTPLNQSGATVDGESGYVFDSVSVNARTSILSNPPIIGKEEEMYGSIYENVNMRKFTVYFYGGFDGWDVYRDQRTNTDNFKMSQYKGYINNNSGEGYSFSKIADAEALGLNQNGITSDWYAYLSGIRQFANPEEVDINILATPGIDYVNNRLLTEEVIDMVENERADCLYVATTPDKPSGAGDFVDEMYTPEDAVYNLEDSEIDSSYACTYYPWVKYLDADNNQYIYLPPTKDVVRNMAQTDNERYSWFAPAGLERGSVDAVRARFITKIADEDALYAAGINPIKTFAQEGPLVWGQKTMVGTEQLRDRINVRRLMLRVRKLIMMSCIGLIFEPNDATASQSLRSTITPILDNIRSNRGLYDYRIEIDDSVEARERHELPCKIFLKPTVTLEYIPITFVLTPQGMSFDDL